MFHILLLSRWRNPLLHLSLALARLAVISFHSFYIFFPGGFLVQRAAVAFPTFIPSRGKLIVMEMTASVRPAESAFCRKLTRSAHDYSVFPSVKTERLAIYNRLLKSASGISDPLFVNLVNVSLSLRLEIQVCVSEIEKKEKPNPPFYPLKCGAYSWMKLIASLSPRTKSSLCAVCASDS